MPDAAEAERERNEAGAWVLALAADLIFASRIRGAAAPGVAVRVVGHPEEVYRRATEQRPGLILLDLDHRAGNVPVLIERLKADPATAAVPVVGFVAHVNEAAIRAARVAGVDRVLARSAFVRELPELIRSVSGEG